MVNKKEVMQSVTKLAIALLIALTFRPNINKASPVTDVKAVSETQTIAVAEISPEPLPIVEEIATPKAPEPVTITPPPTGCEIYRQLVEQYAWDTRIAMAVMKAESGCNPEASNWNDRHATCIGSFGLFQLGCFWTSAPYDPATNVAVAYQIYQRGGWQPWGAFTSGAYIKFLY